MGDNTPGTCLHCGKTAKRGSMARHLQSCVGKADGNLHLAVMDGPYWMHLALTGDSEVYDLDRFLRAAWLECCGHMSQLQVGRRVFSRNPSSDSFFGAEEEGMDQPLKGALPEGATGTYDYDFGSTTRLEVRRSAWSPPVKKGVRIQVLARNDPMEITCTRCKQDGIEPPAPAAYVHSWERLALCKKHGRRRDEGLLPVVNSPRMGVCGYDADDKSFPITWGKATAQRR